MVREGRSFCGLDAVIDKDLASAKLAKKVGVDIFLIATDEKGGGTQLRSAGTGIFRHSNG